MTQQNTEPRSPYLPGGPTGDAAVRVSTLELFFDLVFVFTVTQLTAVLAVDFSVASYGRVALMLGVIWWMYAGYAWLTNAVSPSSTVRRTLLLTGMASFLVAALAIPDAFGGTGWAFGLAYFVINLVHSGLFWMAGGRGVMRALAWLGPLNLVSATLVLVGGFVPLPWRYVCWTAALLLQIVTPYLHPIGGFSVAPGHFVERHGLVIIVALGESVVAIGLGAAEEHLDLSLIAVAVAGLVISYYLWWAYFGFDENRAEHALATVPDAGVRARLALRAFGYAHFPMLIGIVALAAGVKKAIGHAFDPLALGPAVAIGAGAALFMLAHAWFRQILRTGRLGYRLAAAAGALATIPLGAVDAATQLVAMVVVLAVPMSIEGYRLVRLAKPVA